jgi:hypothetical protein
VVGEKQMSNGGQEQNIDFTVDKDNLYREESVTDLKIASIRRLIPVKLDGTEDKSRTHIFIGHTQLMSPQGPVPLQAPLEANNIEEALGVFPKAMEGAMAKMVENIKKMQEKQQQQQQQGQQGDGSRIIMPGR